jgi:hypothetical protein
MPNTSSVTIYSYIVVSGVKTIQFQVVHPTNIVRSLT